MDAQMKMCSIPGCNQDLRARGWCGKHYQTWQRTGDPVAPCGGRRARPSKTLLTVPEDPAVLGYLAGLMDGEGCIRFARVGERSVTPQIQIGMTYEPIMQWLVGEVGGEYRLHKRKIQAKDLYNWRIYGANVVELLRALYPYLRVKRAQAELIFEFAATGAQPGDWEGRRGNRQSARLIDEREALVRRMRALNKKGRRA